MTETVAFRTPNWLGDAVLATVVLPALRRGRPEARIEVVTPAPLVDLFVASPHVDDVVGFEAGREVDAYRSRRYDRVLLGPTSFGSAWRAWRGGARGRAGFATSRRGLLLSQRGRADGYRRDRHQVENYRELAGLLGASRPEDEPRVETRDEWIREAERLWPPGEKARAVLQPGATYGPAKRWPANRFAAIGRALRDDGVDVALVGGPGDRSVVAEVSEGAGGVVDLAGRTSVGVLAAILKGADVLITNDTGPMHLAAAVGTRTIALFGSTSPTWTRPWGEDHRVLTHAVPCAPCFRRDCEIGYPCLLGISEGQVLSETRRALQEVTA